MSKSDDFAAPVLAIHAGDDDPPFGVKPYKAELFAVRVPH